MYKEDPQVPPHAPLMEQAVAESLQWIAKEAPSRLELFERVFSPSNRSRAEAVKAKCLECGDLTDKEVRECTCYACPLYHFRPFKLRGEGR
jgi:hypothetical protein